MKVLFFSSIPLAICKPLTVSFLGKNVVCAKVIVTKMSRLLLRIFTDSFIIGRVSLGMRLVESKYNKRFWDMLSAQLS